MLTIYKTGTFTNKAGQNMNILDTTRVTSGVTAPHGTNLSIPYHELMIEKSTH